MTNPAIGFPAVVINNLPGPLNIQSTTIGPPAVITTTTPHNILPGEYFIVAGATDPNLNGIVFMAGTVTSTNIAVLDQPGGTPVTGSLAGGAAGTVQSLGFGTTVPLLSDGDAPTALLWNVIYQALLNYTAYLLYAKANLNGGNTWTGNQVFGGGVTFNNTVHMSGGLVTVTAPITMSGITTISGRRVRGARTVLPEILVGPYTQTISVTGGNRFEVVNAPANVQVIKLSDTSPTPQANETIEILVPGPMSTGKFYEIRRADGTLIAEYYGNTAGDAGAWAEFEFVGGVWRLGANGGGGSAGGVLAGPGA